MDVAAGETFLAMRGQIEPLRRRLVESQAGSKILGAFIVHSMRQAQGSEDPRNGLGARIRELAEEHHRVLGAGVGAPGERARDFLVPVVAALHSFSEMIAAAYRSQGREPLATKVEDSVVKDRKDLLTAWKRHRSLYGEKAERAASINVVQAVTAPIASGKARFGYEADSNPQCLPIGRILKNGDIFLLPDPVTAVLQSMGQRDATKDLVIKALGDIARSESQWVGHGKGAGTVRGWRITPEDWAKAQDLTRPSEPEQEAVVEADPPREPTLSLVAEDAPSVVQTLQLNGRTVTWDGNIIKSPGRPDRRTVIDDGWEIVVEAA